MKLADFYQPSIKITLEENIADISVEDEDTIIKPVPAAVNSYRARMVGDLNLTPTPSTNWCGVSPKDKHLILY